MSVEQLTGQNKVEQGPISKLATVERASYPQMREQFKKGVETMVTSSRGKLIVTSHTRPDPDAMGGALGFAEILKKKYPGRQVEVIFSEKPIHAFDDLPGIQNVLWAAEKKQTKNGIDRDGDIIDYINRDDLLICLDGGTFNKFSRAPEFSEQALKENPQRTFPCNTIILDHHQDSPSAAGLSYIEPEATATCELLSNIYSDSLDTISPEAATLLWLGIADDTNNLATIDNPAKKIETESLFRKLQQRSGKTVEQLQKLIRHSPQEEHFKEAFQKHTTSVPSEPGMPSIEYSFATSAELAPTMESTQLEYDRMRARRAYATEQVLKGASEIQFNFTPLTTNAAGVTNKYSVMLRRRNGVGIDLGRIARVLSGGGHAGAASGQIELTPEQIRTIEAQKSQNQNTNENELIAKLILDKIRPLLKAQAYLSNRPSSLAA